LWQHVSDSRNNGFRLFAQFEDKRQPRVIKERPRDDSFIQQAIDATPLADGEPLALGCRVLITLNHPGRAYVNGDTGELVEARGVYGNDLKDELVAGKEVNPASLGIRLDRTGEIVYVTMVTQETKDPMGINVIHSVTGIPVKLGYACTIHKSQGMTVDKAWVDMASLKRFPDSESRHGLAYVALSRTRTIDGLLLGSWDPQVVHCDPAISELL